MVVLLVSGLVMFDVGASVWVQRDLSIFGLIVATAAAMLDQQPRRQWCGFEGLGYAVPWSVAAG